MKRILPFLVLNTILISATCSAATITNGDFATCDYSGWSQASDLDPIAPDDFTIIDNGGTCSAQISADLSDAFGNILFQEIDLSASDSSQLWLSLDFSVDSALSDQAPLTADYFSVYLNDGSGNLFDQDMNFGALFDAIDINGAASYQQQILLADSYKNQTGWFLEFQINSNFDFEAASITVNSVALDAVEAVSAPAGLSLVVLGFAFAGWRQRTLIKEVTHV